MSDDNIESQHTMYAIDISRENSIAINNIQEYFHILSQFIYLYFAYKNHMPRYNFRRG